MIDDPGAAAPPAAGSRLKLGGAMFALSIALPVLGVPLVTAMGLPAATTATVSGVILVGAEGLGIAAVAVMGKSGYLYLKSRIFGFLNQYGPRQQVSRARYSIGLIMFAAPIVLGWVAPYAMPLVPGLNANLLTYALAGDLLLVVSLFILGGDFWDKLRALFNHESRVRLGKLDPA